MLQTNVILAPGDNIFQSIVLLALSLPHCCSIRQIYCPLDEPSSAFHRCLYLFCCHQNQCIQNGRSSPPPLHPPINLLSRSISSLSISSLSLSLSRSVSPNTPRSISLLCLRSQLPKENDFYSLDPTQSLSDTPLTVASADVPLCLVCGSQLRIPSPPPLPLSSFISLLSLPYSCLGNFQCGKCHQASYCSRDHQKLDWSHHKTLCGKSDAQPSEPPPLQRENFRLFPSYNLAIEAEDLHEQLEEQSHLIPQEGLSVSLSTSTLLSL
jgi:hypothetical protein